MVTPVRALEGIIRVAVYGKVERRTDCKVEQPVKTDAVAMNAIMNFFMIINLIAYL
jgi:hypothetical protein